MDFRAFTDEFCKLAARPISEDEARKSLNKIKAMDAQRDMGALGRAAATGAVVAPAAQFLGRTIAGTNKLLKPGATFNIRKPGEALKAINWGGLGRQAAADAAMGSIIGGALPLAREGVERRAQKAKLENYIDQETGGRKGRSLRRQIQASTGL